MNHDTKVKNSASHQAYEIIRDQILNGHIASGTKMVEEQLARESGFSRTPVREALRQLEYEGLIVNKRIVQPTERDLKDLFQVRILLEGFASQMAATYLTERELDLLFDCITQGYKGSTEEIMTANQQFHEIIVHASGNEQLIRIIDRMQSIIYLFRKTVVLNRRPNLIREHEGIYEAIKSRDKKKAKQLMEEHIQADLDFCLNVLSRADYI